MNIRKVTKAVTFNQSVKKVTASKGAKILFRVVRGERTNLDDKYHTAFIAETPAIGYVVYKFFTEKEEVNMIELL